MKSLKTGNKPDGKQMLPPMPWPNLIHLSDADANALAAYLMSLPPVSHKVPDALPPGAEYAGATIVFPAPGKWDAPAEAAPTGK